MHVNIPASRLTALLIVAAAYLTNGASSSAPWQAMWRDGSKHASPNAGYPEAAMAGALGLSLAGPRVYHGAMTDDAWIGDGRREATPPTSAPRSSFTDRGRRPADRRHRVRVGGRSSR